MYGGILIILVGVHLIMIWTLIRIIAVKLLKHFKEWLFLKPYPVKCQESSSHDLYINYSLNKVICRQLQIDDPDNFLQPLLFSFASIFKLILCQK